MIYHDSINRYENTILSSRSYIAYCNHLYIYINRTIEAYNKQSYSKIQKTKSFN